MNVAVSQPVAGHDHRRLCHTNRAGRPNAAKSTSSTGRWSFAHTEPDQQFADANRVNDHRGPSVRGRREPPDSQGACTAPGIPQPARGRGLQERAVSSADVWQRQRRGRTDRQTIWDPAIVCVRSSYDPGAQVISQRLPSGSAMYPE